MLELSWLVTLAFAQNSNQSSITGVWEGSATVRGQQVPIRLEVSGSASGLKAALLNEGEQAQASSVAFGDGHLLLNFNYFARPSKPRLRMVNSRAPPVYFAHHRLSPGCR